MSDDYQGAHRWDPPAVGPSRATMIAMRVRSDLVARVEMLREQSAPWIAAYPFGRHDVAFGQGPRFDPNEKQPAPPTSARTRVLKHVAQLRSDRVDAARLGLSMVELRKMAGAWYGMPRRDAG